MGRLFFDDEDEEYRLHDIRVDEVSPVDRAANQRQFLIIKNWSGEMGNSPEVITDKDGNLVTDKDAEKANASIPGPVKEAVVRSATEALNRLQSFVNAAKGATATDDQSKTPLPAEMGRELRAISGLLGGIGEKYPSPMSKDEEGEGDGDKTEKKDDDSGAKILATLDELKKLIAKAPAEKSEDEAGASDKDTAQSSPAMEALAKGFETLASAVTKQAEQLAEIRKSHGGPLGFVPEGDADREDRVSWPLDLAAEVRANR